MRKEARVETTELVFKPMRGDKTFQLLPSRHHLAGVIRILAGSLKELANKKLIDARTLSIDNVLEQKPDKCLLRLGHLHPPFKAGAIGVCPSNLDKTLVYELLESLVLNLAVRYKHWAAQKSNIRTFLGRGQSYILAVDILHFEVLSGV